MSSMHTHVEPVKIPDYFGSDAPSLAITQCFEQKIGFAVDTTDLCKVVDVMYENTMHLSQWIILATLFFHIEMQ